MYMNGYACVFRFSCACTCVHVETQGQRYQWLRCETLPLTGLELTDSGRLAHESLSFHFHLLNSGSASLDHCAGFSTWVLSI